MAEILYLLLVFDVPLLLGVGFCVGVGVGAGVDSGSGSVREGGASLSLELLFSLELELSPESLKLKLSGMLGGSSSTAKAVRAEPARILVVRAESIRSWRNFLFSLFIFDFLLYQLYLL